MWQGECRSLDIIPDRTNDQPVLAKTSDVSGQYWKITPAGSGHNRLTNMWQGVTKSLDIVNDGTNNRPILARTGDFSGQFWRITPTGGGYFRITNAWQGDGKSLDIINDGRDDNRPTLSRTGDFFGQYWKISLAKFITAPPASLRLNSFYRKYLDADGIPVISSDRVPDAALHQVRFMALHMLSKKPEVLAEMVRHGARIAVMAKTEVTTNIPEHAHLRSDRSENWDTRARGLGGMISVPTGSCAEENVLCYGDANRCNGEEYKYRCEDIFIHEFAHSIHNLGLVFAYPGFQAELDAAYSNARRSGLWTNTYTVKNTQEYFAEGVQDWFNVNNPPNDQHNHVNTRDELRSYDIGLYNLLKKYFPEDINKCSCH